MLICTLIKLVATGRTARNGDHLFLPYKDNTQEEAGRIIDRRLLRGKSWYRNTATDFQTQKRHLEKRLS